MAPTMEDSYSPWAEATYTPSVASIQRLKKELRQSQVKQAAPSAWLTDGPQPVDSLDRIDESPEWLLQLNLEDLQEIEDAAAHFYRTGLPHNQLQAEHFPLPTLRNKLRERSMLLHNDKPFFAIRGLKPQWFSKEKNVIIYLGIASHVGTKRAMAKGDPDVLHHITSIEIPKEEEEVTYRGPANRTMAIPFHNDYGEILALYTLSRAASGGDFYLADIEKAASRIAMRRPDLLEVLRENYTMAAPGLDKGFEERPLLFDTQSNGMVVQASRSRLCNGIRPRPCGLAPLTERQVEAMDALHAASQEVAMRFSFLSGDMLFFNNMKMMHSRDAYVDGCEEDNTTRRYLLRLILKDELNHNWEVPPEMEPTWKCMYDHEDHDEIIPLHPGLFSYKAAH